MTRKRFIKKLMAHGYDKRTLEKASKALLEKRDELKRDGENVAVTWENVYLDFVKREAIFGHKFVNDTLKRIVKEKEVE